MLRRRALLAAAATFLSTPALAAQHFTLDSFNIGGTGRFDYLSVDPATGRVFVSRSTHVMVIDGLHGTVVGDIQDTPGVHGIAFAPKSHHGFTTNGGDSSLTMFDLSSLATIRKIHTGTAGHDGILYDDATDRIFAVNHGRPAGSLTAIDATSGAVVGSVALNGRAPEGSASDGHGRIYVNVEDQNAVAVIDARGLSVVTTWPLAGCDGPGGMALDRKTQRLFVACGDSDSDVVVNTATGAIVARFPIGAGPDALGFDPDERLIYTPGGGGRRAGGAGTVTIAHEDGPDQYHVVATVTTMQGARTLAVDPERHRAYTFTPAYGPATTADSAGRGGRGAPRPITAAWLFVITH